MHSKRNLFLTICKPFLLLGMIPMTTGPSDAQTPTAERLTLNQALIEATEKNPYLLTQKFESASAESDIVSAGLRPNPSININGDLLPSNGLSPNDKSYGVSLAVPFEFGDKRDARLAYAHLQRGVTELKYKDAQRQIIYAVKNAYLDVLTSQRKAIVARDNLVLFDSLVSLNRIRVAGQEIAAVDLARSEVEREKISLDVLTTREQNRSATTLLLALIGRQASGKSVQIETDSLLIIRIASIADNPMPSFDTLLRVAIRERKDLQALQMAEDASLAQIAVAKSLASIDLTVSLDALRQQRVTFWGVSLNFPLPIFDRHQGDIQKAEAQAGQAQAQTHGAFVQLQADISNALGDAETKRESLIKLRDNILQKSQSVRASVEYAYLRGSTSLIDFLDAVRTENEVHELYVDALGSYGKSLITLDYIIGKDLLYEIQ